MTGDHIVTSCKTDGIRKMRQHQMAFNPYLVRWPTVDTLQFAEKCKLTKTLAHSIRHYAIAVDVDVVARGDKNNGENN